MKSRADIRLCGWVVGLVALLGSCAHRVPSPLEIAGLPHLDLPAVGRQEFHPDLLAGKVVLVQFFATWCFLCLTDLPNLEVLQSRYGPKGFQAILLGVDLEGKKVLEPFAYKFDLPIPVLVADERIRNGESPFGLIRGVPQSFLFGTDGRLEAAWVGVAPPAKVASRVEGLLPRAVYRPPP